MGEKLDPQVQARLIDIAAKWVEETRQIETGIVGQDALIEKKTKAFEKAYTAMVGIVGRE